MINKQSIWFVTLFSLILVLSIYYVTLNDSSLQNILNNEEPTSSETVSVNVNESSLLVSLRVEEEKNVLEQMDNYQSILLDSTKTSEEKNNAFNSLMSLSQKKSDEEKVEKMIKEKFQLDSFVKIKNDTISIVVAQEKQDSTLANKILRETKNLFSTEKYVTVKFQKA